MFGFDIGSIAKGVMEGVVGPLFGWLNKKEDVKIEQFKVDGVVDVEAVRGHIALLQARRDVLLEAMKYRGMRMVQYGFMVPLVIWFNAIIFYCIAHPYFPEVQKVLALPANLEYILSGIIAFLFLSSKIDDWKRKT